MAGDGKRGVVGSVCGHRQTSVGDREPAAPDHRGAVLPVGTPGDGAARTAMSRGDVGWSVTNPGGYGDGADATAEAALAGADGRASNHHTHARSMIRHHSPDERYSTEGQYVI